MFYEKHGDEDDASGGSAAPPSLSEIPLFSSIWGQCDSEAEDSEVDCDSEACTDSESRVSDDVSSRGVMGMGEGMTGSAQAGETYGGELRLEGG